MGSIVPTADIGSMVAAPFNLAGTMMSNHANKEIAKHTNASNESINAANLAFQSEEAEKTREFNSSEAEKARQFDREEAEKARNAETASALELMREQTRLNSPAAQIAALRAAGANPNLFQSAATGLGSAGSAVASGPAASASPASAPNSIPMQPYDYHSPLSQISEDMLKMAQVRNLNEQTDRMEKLLPGELKSQNVTISLGEAELEMKPLEKKKLQAELDQMSVTLEATRVSMDEARSRIALNEMDTKQKEIFIENLKDRLAAELSESLARTRHLNAQIPLIASQIAEHYANAANADSLTALNNIEFGYKGKMCRLAYDSAKSSLDVQIEEDKTRKRVASTRNTTALSGAFDAADVMLGTIGKVFNGFGVTSVVK